jgi:hypothetical protein
VPYPVSLVSKVLFGLAAAEAFRRQDVLALRGRPSPYCAEPSMITVTPKRRISAMTKTLPRFE